MFHPSSKLRFCITDESLWKLETNLQKQPQEVPCKKVAFKIKILQISEESTCV